jgi:hypothetical protein
MEPAEIEQQCSTIVTNVRKCRKHVHLLHGQNSEHEKKTLLPLFDTHIDNQSSYVQPKKLVHLHFNDPTESVILNGLCGNTVVICNKINHVMLRQCSDVNLYVKKGAISGLDMLGCHRLSISLPILNYVGIEYGENIHFLAETNDDTQIRVKGSMDVTLNRDILPVNPFINVILTHTRLT